MATLISANKKIEEYKRCLECNKPFVQEIKGYFVTWRVCIHCDKALIKIHGEDRLWWVNKAKVIRRYEV